MSVYVSEINMPKGEGSKLILQIFPNGEVYDVHGIRLGIANWAKAVPVPPHGRLIDAKYIRNAIIQEWMDKADDSHMYKRGMEDAYEIIRNAPTIIPAEEG